MTDEQSGRLGKPRQYSDTGGHQEEPAPEQRASPARQSDSSQTSSENRANPDPGTDEDVSIKDQRVGTYMYLPENQAKEIRRLYNVLKAEYEFKYDTEFEKNRHFYPLVVKHGLNHLTQLDAAELRDHVEDLP